MKIAFVSTYDATDPSIFGAMGYWEARALQQQGVEVDFLGPLQEVHSHYFRFKQAWHKYVKHRHHTRNREPAMIRAHARQVERKLNAGKYDIVFSAISPGSQPIAYLETNIPIVLWTDATFAGVLDFYPEFSSNRLSPATVRNGLANEKSALQRATMPMYWSDWAAQTAIVNHGIDAAKVKIVAPGPCLQSDRTARQVAAMLESRRFDVCKLLFIGVAWHRKGADTALAVATRLNQAGVKTELTFVGCSPPPGVVLPEFARSLGFINKNTPEGAERIRQLLGESHFFIMPSRAECFGLVFAEASSFGLPSLSTNVGGIPTAIRNDINGRTFALDADPDEYANYVANLMSRPDRYRDLAFSSYHEYETRLNWITAGSQVIELLEEVLGTRGPRKPYTIPKSPPLAA